MAFTLHHNAAYETDPLAVVTTSNDINGDPKFEDGRLAGEWLRVFPQTSQDVRFLKDLEHHVEKFAPARGIGVLIHRNALMMLVRP